MEDGGWRMEDGGWRMEDGGWRMEDGGWRMEDGGWRMETVPRHWSERGKTWGNLFVQVRMRWRDHGRWSIHSLTTLDACCRTTKTSGWNRDKSTPFKTKNQHTLLAEILVDVHAHERAADLRAARKDKRTARCSRGRAGAIAATSDRVGKQRATE